MFSPTALSSLSSAAVPSSAVFSQNLIYRYICIPAVVLSDGIACNCAIMPADDALVVLIPTPRSVDSAPGAASRKAGTLDRISRAAWGMSLLTTRSRYSSSRSRGYELIFEVVQNFFTRSDADAKCASLISFTVAEMTEYMSRKVS